MLHLLYRTLGTVSYLALVCFFPLIRIFGGRYGYGLEQRLGQYVESVGKAKPGFRTLWIHASSVGEAQAAIILIIELLKTGEELQIILTSTTEQGNKMARSRLPEKVLCLMAPLDAPPAVRRALGVVRPDLYVCLETELWPVMLVEARERGVPLLMLNGRLSERSFSRYRWIRPFMQGLLAGFQSVAVISEADGQRFIGLGVPEQLIQVCGNLKYDMPADNPERHRTLYRKRLGASSQAVFICGSTHEGEEEMLLPVFQRLAVSFPLIWVVAPRHLERLPSIEAFFRRSGLDFTRYSQLATTNREAEVVLVDTMGDLANLYSSGDFIFCGGSLVEQGGHNIMEAARWGRPVYFGPYMKDFFDAAELLAAAGGGFQVRSADELATLLLYHQAHRGAYQAACSCAAAIAARQRGAVARQAAIVRRVLASMERVTGGTPLLL